MIDTVETKSARPARPEAGAGNRRSRATIARSSFLDVSTQPAGQSILERVAAGDRLAVGECLDRYGDLVWSLARRYLRNAADAEDAVQDIFIDVWGSAGRYDRNIASEVAFISTIARRRLIDKIRQADRRPVTDSLDDEDNAPMVPGIPATAEEDTEVTIVERVMGNMDPEHQKVLAMSLYEGYSHSEIAERLSLPLGTVKTRVRRGLIHIRAQLNIEAGGSDPAEEAAG
jgi:RNA polymerase sigma factor (sigma-70 family)